ncbi:MAG: hypothetical protein U5K38_10400 [Woeseiaceae bacterium]|nr:hypothetical protein [Woeseiaceae bacterium]
MGVIANIAPEPQGYCNEGTIRRYRDDDARLEYSAHNGEWMNGDPHQRTFDDYTPSYC